MNAWERISEHARAIHPAATARRIGLAPFWLAGQLAGAVLAAAWAVLRWSWAAFAVGFEQATANRLPRVDSGVVAQWVLAVAVIAVAVILVVF